jgi:hypothetical protein
MQAFAELRLVLKIHLSTILAVALFAVPFYVAMILIQGEMMHRRAGYSHYYLNLKSFLPLMWRPLR